MGLAWLLLIITPCASYKKEDRVSFLRTEHSGWKHPWGRKGGVSEAENISQTLWVPYQWDTEQSKCPTPLLEKKERNIKAKFAYFLVLPTTRLNRLPNFSIYKRYMLKAKLAAPKSFQMILKRAFCLGWKMQYSAKFYVRWATPNNLQVANKCYIFIKHGIFPACANILSLYILVCNRHTILWIGFKMNHMIRSIRNIFLIETN
jgi:hypothetical protein